MTRLPTNEPGVEPAPVADAFWLSRLLIYAGAVGTIVLALNGVLAVLGRLSQRGAMSELVVIIPLWAIVGVWILSPYWGALTLHKRWATTRSEAVVIGLVVLVLIALGANSFLATSAFVGGRPRPTADGVTLVVIPMVQWVVLGAAGLLLRLFRAVRHRRQAA